MTQQHSRVEKFRSAIDHLQKARLAMIGCTVGYDTAEVERLEDDFTALELSCLRLAREQLRPATHVRLLKAD